MLHPFHIMVDDAIVDSEQLKEVGQQLVTTSDVARQCFARCGQHQAAILLVFQQTLGVEALTEQLKRRPAFLAQLNAARR